MLIEMKVINVVQSCNTLEQLESAQRYIILYKKHKRSKIYGITCEMLDEIIQNRKLVILLQ
jgi:hypothetical protein